MARDRARAFLKLRYRDPKALLIELRKIELALPANIRPEIRHLRTNELKPLRELRQAALFCYGWEQIDGQRLLVAPYEADDFDAVATWVSDAQINFAPIQVKEVVPKELNHKASVERVIDGLKEYVNSEDLTVVIHLNRNVQGFSPLELKLPPLKIAALWIVASVATDQTRWMI
jgi:hypothetical protein